RHVRTPQRVARPTDADALLIPAPSTARGLARQHARHCAVRLEADDRNPSCTFPGTASPGRRCPANSVGARAAPAPSHETAYGQVDTPPTRRCHRVARRERDHAWRSGLPMSRTGSRVGGTNTP